MSWESSLEYYRIINESVRARLGGLHSAQSLMYSVDFAPIETLQHQARWDEAAQILIAAARSLERGSADYIVLCTNTMHKVADAIQNSIHIPLLHIADATAQQVQAQGLTRVGLLGTKFTMEQGFYTERLANQYDLDVLIPEADDRDIVHRVIYDELCLGDIQEVSRARYRAIVQRLVDGGAQGIILGCTGIGLLIHAADSPVPLLDTTRIHALAAVDMALA